MTGIAQLAGRVMLALMFILAGIGKIAEPAGTVAYMESAGLPGLLLWPTIALELICGIALAVGYKTQWAAFALAGFSIVASLVFHTNFADEMQMYLFLKNIAVAGGLLILATSSKTAYSLEK